MENLFVSKAGKLRERWREAFPSADVVSAIHAGVRAEIVWIDTSFLAPEELDAQLEESLAAGFSTVVLSPTPSEPEAAHVMARGARGYAHVLAASKSLLEIASVISRGGVWMEPGMMTSLLKITEKLISPGGSGATELAVLTARELSVAELVASGASNREIAEHLDITERTVKAHLTAIFEKLAVRDRVQLAIKVLGSLS